jgi:hypothetical protein
MRHPIQLVIKIFLCWGHPLMSIHMWQISSCFTTLFIFCICREIYPRASSSNFIVTYFISMFLPGP